MRRLTELMAPSLGDAAPGPTPETLLAEWANIPYAQLSVVLVYLRFLALVHQTHHWTAKGDPYYGDHLLFERLYNETEAEIDGVAEKSIGLGNEQNVDINLQASQLNELVTSLHAGQALPEESELAKRSLEAERSFIKVVSAMLASLKQTNAMTDGVENMLQGIVDAHESHVYLLRRRCSDTNSGV